MNTRTWPSIRTLSVVVVIGSVGLSTGCATRSSSSSVYSPAQAQREQTVRMGIVESVRSVSIEQRPSGVGAATGGIVGGVAGASLGGGRGSIVTSVLGAVAGGLAGQAIEGGVTRKAGLEITVKLDNGELRAITQEGDESFRPGERVRLLSGSGVTRVSH